jgi:YVTN family beta-propeller protein
MKRWSLALVLSVLLSGICVALFGDTAGYHLLKKISFPAAEGGSEYFDYITFDPATRRVYLAHGTEVLVVEADSGKLAGKITGLKRCHGVALVPDLGRGFITDGSAAEIIMFDTKTLKTLGRIKGEPDADAIRYDPASKHIFVFNGDSHSATVIDPAKGTVITSLPLGGAPEQAVVDGKGMIYDNLEDKNEVIAIDSRALKITARWPVAPTGSPTSMAMDRAHRRLFIGGRNPAVFVVMNADTGKIVGPSFPIGKRVDSNIFDPETGFVACSTGDGTIHIFHEDSPDKYTEVQTVTTEPGAKTMALDPKTHNLLVDTSDFAAPAQGQRQPRAVPGTFRLLIYGR